ncbi:MAG TPA: FeoA family protein [Allocoleopsis sp.]
MKDRNDPIKNRGEGSTSSSWQGFVYLSDSIDQRTHKSNRLPNSTDRSLNTPEKSSPNTFPLSSRRSGYVRLVSLNCGKSNNRLRQIGFVPGVVVKVISCTPTGSVIVALKDQQLGLGAAMAERIQVTDVE